MESNFERAVKSVNSTYMKLHGAPQTVLNLRTNNCIKQSHEYITCSTIMGLYVIVNTCLQHTRVEAICSQLQAYVQSYLLFNQPSRLLHVFKL